MKYEGNEELKALEHGAPKYNKFLVNKFAEYLPSDHSHGPSLDFGAGIGALSVLWKEFGYGQIECLEPDALQSRVIRDRGLVAYAGLNELKEDYHFIFTSNVLEHIENDEAVLAELVKKALAQNGVLVIYVPAFQMLYSQMDRKVGHYRRYSRQRLITAAQSAGLRVIHCEYVDSLGFFATLLLKLFNLGSDTATSELVLRIYDNLVFPMSRVMDKLGARRYIGKNLLLVARKD